jgi:glycosyltransferase involved in cell wall biosynthesis
MQGISVVLPNFNHAVELETSLSAIAGQTRPFDEIIVIDDASTDHSLEVIRRFASTNSQMRLLQNEKRMGVAISVNRGIEAASRRHLVLASADEKVERGMCETFHGALQEFPDLSLAVSCYREWDEQTGVVTDYGRQPGLGMWYASQDDLFFVSPEQFLNLLKQQFVWLGINTAMFRRDMLLRVGGFDPALRWHSDWFAIYAIAFRHGFCAIPKTLATFRRSAHSYSARGMRDAEVHEQVILSIVEKLERPEFSDFDRAARQAPATLSPFVRTMIPALLKQPRRYRLLARLVLWWLGEFARFRRPGWVLRLRERLTGNNEQASALLSSDMIRQQNETPSAGDRA